MKAKAARRLSPAATELIESLPDADVVMIVGLIAGFADVRGVAAPSFVRLLTPIQRAIYREKRRADTTPRGRRRR